MIFRGKLPDVFFNALSALGAFVAALAASAILILILMDLLLGKSTLYLGLVAYIVLPAILSGGLLLIAAGAWRERRRRARGEASRFPKEYHLNLTDPVQRNALLGIIFVGTLFLIGTSVGTYKAYQVTESTEFCGRLCHTIMKPEYTAYQSSSHARVACVACHIGPGAGWFVKSKLSGAYQVYATLARKYPRPIPTPISNLRPARETCEQCHWPEKFFGARSVVNPHFLADETNTPAPISLLVNIGGGSAGERSEGIHWHMIINNKVEYIARDRLRQDIAWVRTTNRAGKVVEYNNADNPLSPEEKGKADVRVMDCMDCHNRPSHNYRSPDRTVNESMSLGRMSPSLPYIKREAVKALDAEYPDTPSALAAIEEKLTDFYRANYPDVLKGRPADVASAVAEAQKIYTHNFFPEMKVAWKGYPYNIGHEEFPGCFRCHGSSLTSSDGKTISKDCRSCHIILSQGTGTEGASLSPRGLEFKHPVDVGGAETSGQCAACHKGGADLY